EVEIGLRTTARLRLMHGFRFPDLSEAPVGHFKLYFLAAVLHVLERLAGNLGSAAEVVEQFPFVSDYLDEVDQWAGIGTPSAEATTQWLALIRGWEAGVSGHLPLRALRETLRLDDSTLTLLLAI